MSDVSIGAPSDDARALSDDTAVAGGGGKYTAEVSLRWDNRGRPLGAVIAGAMARAASLEAEMPTPVSSTTEFLYPLDPGRVELICEIRRRSSVLCCVNTLAVQAERVVCQGTTWLTVRDSPQVYAAAPPDTPHWTEIGLGPSLFPHSLEQRYLHSADDFAARAESTPYGLTWARFPAGSPGRDLVTMACEVLLVGDLYPPLTVLKASPQWEVIAMGAQTIELSAHMGSFEDPSDQLLVECVSACMSEALLTGIVRVWSENMALRGQVTATYRLPRNRPAG